MGFIAPKPVSRLLTADINALELVVVVRLNTSNVPRFVDVVLGVATIHVPRPVILAGAVAVVLAHARFSVLIPIVIRCAMSHAHLAFSDAHGTANIEENAPCLAQLLVIDFRVQNAVRRF